MKILIINENRSNSTGGIEKYTNQLINIFKKYNHDVFEYAFNLNPERLNLWELNNNATHLNYIKDSNKQSISFFEKRKRIKKGIKEIEKIFNDYDIVINQTNNFKWHKQFYNSKKVIYVQHFNPDFYKQKFIGGRFFWWFFYYSMNLVGIKNPFKVFQNLVFFTNQDKDRLINNKENKNCTIINLCAYSKKEIEHFKNIKTYDNLKQFMYLGRLDNFQKRIVYMQEKMNNLKLNLDIYGNGDKNLIIKSPYINYYGFINNKELGSILNSYKFNILFSKYEGYSFTLVECLSHGIPSIVTNFSPNVTNLVNNKGWIVNKKNIDDIINKAVNINLDEYVKISNNCFEYAINNLSLEVFEKKWIDFINLVFNSTTIK